MRRYRKKLVGGLNQSWTRLDKAINPTRQSPSVASKAWRPVPALTDGHSAMAAVGAYPTLEVSPMPLSQPGHLWSLPQFRQIHLPTVLEAAKSTHLLSNTPYTLTHTHSQPRRSIPTAPPWLPICAHNPYNLYSPAPSSTGSNGKFPWISTTASFGFVWHRCSRERPPLL